MSISLRVLILEDRLSDAELAVLELRKSGFEPDWRRIETESDYLAHLDSALDLILADYSLPQFDGLRALQLLQQRGLDVPFILISGTIGEDIAVEAMKQGAADYLLKDRLARLGYAVAHALEQKQLREEKRQADQALSESEKFFRSCIENVIDLITVVQEDGTILYESPSVERLLGYKPEELVGRNGFEMIHPDDSTILMERIPAIFQAVGTPQTLELRIQRKDGNWQFVESAMRIVTSPSGQIRGIINSRDITERKQSEVVLRETDRRAIHDYEHLLERLARLAQAVGTARDITSVYRGLHEFAETSVPCNGLFVALYDSERQERICVYSGGDGEEDDVSTLPPMPMTGSPQSLAITTGQIIVTDDLQEALASKPVVTLGSDKDPRLPQSSLAVPLTVLGRVIGAFEVQSVEPAAYMPEHVTAMRMAANLAAIATENVQMLESEHQLRLGAEMSEERYRTLAEAAQDAIFIVNHDDRIEYLNSFAASQFGSQAEELIGRTRAGLFPPHVVEHQTRALQEVFETGNSIYNETKTVYPTGEIWIGTRLAPIRNAAGEVRAVLGIARDITERKQAELALQEAHDRLEERVRERTTELHAANIALEKASRLKDEFLANMSHELRTPLNAVLNMSESLEEGVYGELKPRQIKILRVIAESGRHLLELINDILDLSKIEAGKLELQAEPLVVEAFCQASMRMIKESAFQKHLQVSMSNTSNIETIHADGRRLKQMLVNLLSNAVKFTLAGGQVGLEVSKEGDHAIRFTVWDSGIGIPADQLEKLFKPFVQLDSSLSRQYAGTGLGLALVRNLAELHGGSVGLESEAGKGSRFYFIIPTQSLNMPSAEKAKPSAGLKPNETKTKHKVQKRRILLVEDNATNMLVTSDYLSVKGYQVITATNGFEAIENAQTHKPDLILMDIQMPDFDGVEAIRRLRATPEFGSVPIIALTALAMPGDRERCLEAGANEYIPKPASLKNLVERMENLFQQ